MWIHFLLAVTGFCGGVIIAGGEVGLIIGLSIIPRYAAITHTTSSIPRYEDATLLGVVLGNLVFLFHLPLPGGVVFLGICGLFFGIFLGSWILALAEVVDIFPIFSRRLHFTRGISAMILSIALGKTLGSFLYYSMRWFP